MRGLIAVLIVTAASALCASASAQTTRPAESRLPVLLDTDIGDDMDDSWALVMLLNNPRFDVKLITTTNGRAEYRSSLIAKFLTLAGRTDIPVGLGAGTLTGTGGQQPWLTGFDRTAYRGKYQTNGPQALVDAVNKSDGPVTIIAIGPLQTLAAALKTDPAIAAKANLVGMQGAVFKGYDGSKTVSPEYNVQQDPAAARAVLSAHWKSITVTPLDTCGLESIRLKGEAFQKIRDRKDPLTRGRMESYAAWKKVESVGKLTDSTTLFDTVAVYLADPAGHPAIKLESLHIRVTDDGKTVVDPAGQLMDVATEWNDTEAFGKYAERSLLSPSDSITRP